jgi:hypothetical protein
VALVKSATMPQCIQSCVLGYLVQQGCATQTRNCFCILPRQPLLEATASCLSQDCLKKMQSSFSPTTWDDHICQFGQTDDYDQASYDQYAEMVHNVRIAMSVILALVCTILILMGCGLISDEEQAPKAGLSLIIIAIILLLVILVPIYTAL